MLDVSGLVHDGDLACYSVAADYGSQHAYIGNVPWWWRYGVPPDISALVTFYRRTGVPGLPTLKPGSQSWITYTQLATAAQAYHSKSGHPLVNVDFKGDPALLSALVWQHQGTWFHATDDQKTYQVTINGSQTQEVAKYWDTLISTGAVSTMDVSKAMADPSIPFLIAPLSTAAMLKAGGVSSEWGAALLAQDDDGTPRCGNEPRHFGVVPHRGPGDPRHLETATEFMRWLTTDPASLQAQLASGIFPASPAAYNQTQALDSYYGIAGLGATAKASVAGLAGKFENGPNMTFVYSQQTKLFANGTLASNLDTLQKNAVDDLQKSYGVAP
jgi:multiple sugar transport system substrate-binding protein